MEYLKIKYQNSCDLGGSVFRDSAENFHYCIYIPANVGEGSYELKEEGRENGDGTFARDFARLQREYTFDVVVPEYTYDCLCHIQMHDLVYITTKYDENSRAFHFRVGPPEWMDGGVCKLQIGFSVDYVINTGCCNVEALTYRPCVTCNALIEVQDWISNLDALYLDPPPATIKDKYFYLVGHLVSGELVNNHLYYYDYVAGDWIEYIGRNYEAICWTDGIDYKFYFDGHFWQPYQLIRDVTDGGATVNIRGFCLPNTWVQLQISTDGITYANTGGVTDGNIFKTYGINLAGLTPGLTYYFRFNMYNNNCNYGYSNVETIVKS